MRRRRSSVSYALRRMLGKPLSSLQLMNDECRFTTSAEEIAYGMIKDAISSNTPLDRLRAASLIIERAEGRAPNIVDEENPKDFRPMVVMLNSGPANVLTQEEIEAADEPREVEVEEEE